MVKKPKEDQANLGWLFYKDYFRDLDFINLAQNQEKIKAKINTILTTSITLNKKNSNLLNIKTFTLKTTYPGLLLGSGYIHELPDIKEQVILGFDFDYTTGIPIIRGSSIKGALKSVFKCEEYVLEVIDRLRGETKNIKKLQEDLFEKGNIVFLDAEIIYIGKDGLLKDDYITPHKKEQNSFSKVYEEFKNPAPLRFIKIAPNVEFEFRFIFNKKYEKYLPFFKQIILDIGLGAKTNVGYGKFIEEK